MKDIVVLAAAGAWVAGLIAVFFEPAYGFAVIGFALLMSIWATLLVGERRP